MLAPAQGPAPFSREDDMRPLIPAAPPPRPQTGYAPAPQPQNAPQAGPPMQIGNVPRPPAAVGAGEPRPQQTAASNGSGVGNFFSNLFGQR